MSQGDSRMTSSIVAENGEVRPSRPLPPLVPAALPPQPNTMRSASSSAATSTIPSAACRPIRTIGWILRALGDEVEDALEQSAGVARPRGALGQRHALGHLDDAEGRELALAGIEQVGSEPDQLLRGRGIGDGYDDPGRKHAFGHDRDPAFAAGRAEAAPSAPHRSSRYGLSRSNSRAWRSTLSSARSVVRSRFSITALATRPK